MFQVIPIFTNSPLRNWNYLLYSDRTGVAFCIDPYDAPTLLNESKRLGIRIKYILNTHEHGDHVAGNLELKEETGAKIFAHPNAKGTIPGLDECLEHGESLYELEGQSLVAWDTPGHTFSHLSFVLQSKQTPQAIFTGDTVFNAGVGNCYRGGDPKVLYNTIKSLIETLPDECLLYPGHDYWENNLSFATTMEPLNDSLIHKESWFPKDKVGNIGLERRINPFFRRSFPSVKETLRKLQEPIETDEDIFIALRKLRDKF